MSPILETLIPGAIAADRGELKKFLETMFAPEGVLDGERAPRTWQYSVGPTHIRVRRQSDDILNNWKFIPLPEVGTSITGYLHADVSEQSTIVGRGRHRRKRPIQGKVENIYWLNDKLELAGLDVQVASYEPILVDLTMKDRPVLNYRTGFFTFRARVEDAALLHHALVTGIGNAKAYGFGMLCINTPTGK